MCGIAGGFGSTHYDYYRITSASASMQHRGPDDEGIALVTYDKGIKIYKGQDSSHADLPRLSSQDMNINHDGVMLHRRLSILDLSEAGFQPMISTCGKYVLAFNGEIYNYIELREELRRQSISFYTNTDTEVLLKAFIAWGTRAFELCVGMWSVSIYDGTKGTLTLCRDRFGIKPLYYIQTRGVLWFSSEIKPLLKLSGEKPLLDQRSCKEHILFGTLSEGKATLFNGVQQLLPGTMLEYDCRADSVNITTYYDLQARLQIRSEYDFREPESTLSVLNDSMSLHMRSDVPVGACLSGGLDSTTLVHLASSHLPSPALISTFSAIYPGSNLSEEIPIREFLKTHPYVQPTFVTPTMQGMHADFDSLLQHQELPFNSTSIYAQWEVMKAVSAAGIKVVLDGQGADEIACGYYTYGGVFVLELLRVFSLFAALKHTLLLLRNTSPSMAKHAAVALAEHLRIRNLGNRNLGKTTDRYLNDDGKLLEISGYPDRWGSDIVDHTLKNIQYGMQQLLRYEDRNSMAFSVEARVPYLDHRVVEYFLGMPSKEKISDGYLKYNLRKAMSTYLPASIAWKKGKLGFVTPQSEWRNTLSSDDLQRAAAGLRDTGIVNPAVLLVRGAAVKLSAAEESEFWRMYTLGRWYDSMINASL